MKVIEKELRKIGEKEKTAQRFTKVESCKRVTTNSRVMFIADTQEPDGLYNGDGQTYTPKESFVFPQWKRCLGNEKDLKSSFLLETKELAQALKTCKPMSDRHENSKGVKDNPVWFQVEPEHVKVLSVCHEGDTETEISGIPIPLTPCCFCLNRKFVELFVAYCKRNRQEFVLVEWFGNLAPVTLSAVGVKYLVAGLSYDLEQERIRCKP